LHRQNPATLVGEKQVEVQERLVLTVTVGDKKKKRGGAEFMHTATPAMVSEGEKEPGNPVAQAVIRPGLEKRESNLKEIEQTTTMGRRERRRIDQGRTRRGRRGLRYREEDRKLHLF